MNFYRYIICIMFTLASVLSVGNHALSIGDVFIADQQEILLDDNATTSNQAVHSNFVLKKSSRESKHKHSDFIAYIASLYRDIPSFNPLFSSKFYTTLLHKDHIWCCVFII